MLSSRASSFRPFLRSRVGRTIALVLACLLSPEPARADLFGGDVAVLAQILLQTYEQVNQLKQQLQTAKDNFELAKQALETDPRNFGDVLNIVRTAQNTYGAIKSDTQQMGFHIESVRGNFARLFPKGRDLKRAKYSDYDSMYGSWQEELRASAEAASHAQANAAVLESQARAAQSALQSSSGADGVVRQLQTVVQMLGVVQTGISTLITTVSTAERVNSNLAASAAEEKLISREERRRRRENYTSRGKPVSTMNRLP
jgi:P-type conjugative transfer protein TrbJ